MRVYLLLTFAFLLLVFGSEPLSAQLSHTFFVVNGQNCAEGSCSLNMLNQEVGRPLPIRLSGEMPSGGLDLFLSTAGREKQLKGISIEFRGYSIGVGAEQLHIPASQVSDLFGTLHPLRLYLGGVNASNSGSVTLHIRRSGQTSDWISLTIHFEGLRIPGTEQPWTNNFLRSGTPVLVPIYPNPVRQGPIFVDLQTFPGASQGYVTVMDLLGTELYRAAVSGASVHQFSSVQFPKGIYFVRVEMDGLVQYTARLVIER